MLLHDDTILLEEDPLLPDQDPLLSPQELAQGPKKGVPKNVSSEKVLVDFFLTSGNKGLVKSFFFILKPLLKVLLNFLGKIVGVMPTKVGWQRPQNCISFRDTPKQKTARRMIATVSVMLFVMLFVSGVGLETNPAKRQKQSLQEDPAIWYNGQGLTWNKAIENTATPLATTTVKPPAVSMTVQYDNLQAENEWFYAAPRTATITIVDAAFDASRLLVKGSATAALSDTERRQQKSDAAMAFPALSPFESEGDTHRASLSFEVDAAYQYELWYQDQDGNKLAAYPKETFVLDQTPPVVELAGVTHQTSYAEPKTIRIKVDDRNLSEEGLTYTLSGAKQGAISLPTLDRTQSNQGGATTERLHKLDLAAITGQEDDIYTLSVKAVDRAGHQTKKQVTFSVNQNGSRYAVKPLKPEQAAERVVSLQQPQSVTIIETNPDAVEADTVQVTMFHNGVPKMLSPFEDYQVTASGGGAWNAKKKWHTYTYELSADLFEADGVYEVVIRSEDVAGNDNRFGAETPLASADPQNTQQPAGFLMVLDRTPPLVTALDVTAGETLAREKREATVRVLDNVALDTVSVWLNGELVTPVQEADYYRIPLARSAFPQTLTVRAVDTTGNETDLIIEGFRVPGRLLLSHPDRIKRLVTGVVVLGWGLVLFLVWRRKRKARASLDVAAESEQEELI